jgi:hypothetical protein
LLSPTQYTGFRRVHPQYVNVHVHLLQMAAAGADMQHFQHSSARLTTATAAIVGTSSVVLPAPQLLCNMPAISCKRQLVDTQHAFF